MSIAVTQGRDRAPLLRWRGLARVILSSVAVLGLLLRSVVIIQQGGERFARGKDFGMVLTGARIIRRDREVAKRIKASKISLPHYRCGT